MPGNRTFFLCAISVTALATAQGFHVSSYAKFHQSRSSSITSTRATTTRLYDATVMPMIDEWRVLPDGSMEGKVVNHPYIHDGSVISTSPLSVSVGTVALNNHGIVVQTLSGSKYRLLKPSDVMAVASDRTVEICIHHEEEQELSKLQKVVKHIKARGLKGAMSFSGWELGYWTVSLPLCVLAFKSITGHWPDFANKADLELLGSEVFFKFNADRFGAPLRIGVGVSTSNWGQKHIMNRFSNNNKEA